jgi:hypothetical protein
MPRQHVPPQHVPPQHVPAASDMPQAYRLSSKPKAWHQLLATTVASQHSAATMPHHTSGLLLQYC